jgi:hypothetical protein
MAQGLLLALGLGALFVPLILLKSSLLVNLCLTAIAVAGYLGGLLLLGLVTPGELSKAWGAMVSRRVPVSPNTVENE